MAGGGKRSRHPCSRALGPDRGSSAPGRPGIDRPTDPWRQPASAQHLDDVCDHQQSPAGRVAGSVAKRRAAVVEGASARGALASCMRRRRKCGADGTTEFQTGEEHDLRSLKKMLLGAVASMAIVAGVAASPASATVPTQGARLPRKPTSRISRGAASTSASASATSTSRSRRTTRRQLGARGLERRSAQRLRSGSAGAVRPASFLQRLRLHGLDVSEGRRRVHQARRQRLTRRPEQLREAVHGRLDGPQHAGRHRRRHRSTPATATSADRRAASSTSIDPYRVCDPTADNTPPRHRERQGQHPAEGQLQRVGPRRSPHDAGRLGQVGRRRRALLARPTAQPTGSPTGTSMTTC